MLSIEIIERMLVNCIIVQARLNEPIDALLSRLLTGRPGYSDRPADGVTFEYQLVSERQVVATGLVVMTGQTVEPIRVDLTLDEGRRHLTAGRVLFGDSARLVRSGSTEHQALRDALLAAPDADFAWKERFRRSDDGWHHDVG